MNHTILNTRLTEEYNARQISSLLIEGICAIFTFHLNLHGYEVIAGIMIEGDQEKQESSITVRFAICSPDDVYDEEVGESIAIGRLFKTREVDAKLNYEIEMSTGSLDEAMDTLVIGKVRDLSKVLLQRDMYQQSIEEQEQEIYTELQSKMKRFK